MSSTLTTFLFEMANFVVLAMALGWLFFKPVRQALNDRRAQFEAAAEQAAQKLAEAEKVQQETDAARANLQGELNELRTRESEVARQQADRLLAEARSAAERELELSRRQASRMSETQRETLAQAAVAATAATVGRLLQQIDGPDLQSALIESACQQLRTLPPDALAPVTIESAAPLPPQHRGALSAALGPAAASADFRTDDRLGPGVRISTAKGLIDTTVRGLVAFAGQTLDKEMNRHLNNHDTLRGANHA